MPEKIVITGATGHVGRIAADLLCARGHAVRLLVRDPDRAPALAGADVLRADYADPESLERALGEGDRVFMVSVDDEPDERVALHRNVIDAASRARVGQLVYLSFLNATLMSAFVHSRSHRATEELIRAARLPFTFLRTSLYVDTILDAAQSGGLRGPGGDRRVSWVSREDCGAVVAAALTQPGHVGQTHDITGPEAPTLSQTAAIVAEVCGRPFPYREETIDDNIARRLAAGESAWYARGWTGMYESVRDGEQETVSDAIQRMTGERPSTVRDFVTANREAFLAATPPRA